MPFRCSHNSKPLQTLSRHNKNQPNHDRCPTLAMWLRQYSHSTHSRQQRTLHRILPIIISADCTDSRLIHHHQSAANKVNVHHRQPTAATAILPTPPLASSPTPPLTSSLKLFNSNNHKSQLVIMGSESGLHLGVNGNVYVLKKAPLCVIIK
jgi:hypothetical protein